MDATITNDGAGRLVLPKAMRERLHLRAGTRLKAEIMADRIELTPEADADACIERRGKRMVIRRWPDVRCRCRHQSGPRRTRRNDLRPVAQGMNSAVDSSVLVSSLRTSEQHSLPDMTPTQTRPIEYQNPRRLIRVLILRPSSYLERLGCRESNFEAHLGGSFVHCDLPVRLHACSPPRLTATQLARSSVLKPSNCTGGTLTRVDARFTGAPRYVD